jgi:hypothetical protein
VSRRHEVVLHRIGRWWAVDVPGLDLHSQCRTLEEVEGPARDLISEAVGAAPEAIVLDMAVTDFAALLGSVREARQPLGVVLVLVAGKALGIFVGTYLASSSGAWVSFSTRASSAPLSRAGATRSSRPAG